MLYIRAIIRRIHELIRLVNKSGKKLIVYNKSNVPSLTNWVSAKFVDRRRSCTGDSVVIQELQGARSKPGVR